MAKGLAPFAILLLMLNAHVDANSPSISATTIYVLVSLIISAHFSFAKLIPI